MAAQQTDVLSSALQAASGLVVTCDTSQNIGRTRVRGIYYNAPAGGGAGKFYLREGSSTGQVRFVIQPSEAASGLLWLPGEGILFQTTPYAVITGTFNVTLFYG
jgi:hypothetical protein